MRLYSGKVKVIASEIARELINSEAIEVEKQNEHEVVLDIESILKEYLRTDREISSEARDIMEARRLNYSKFGRIKRDIAKKRNFGLGEDAIHSPNESYGIFNYLKGIETITMFYKHYAALKA